MSHDAGTAVVGLPPWLPDRMVLHGHRGMRKTVVARERKQTKVLRVHHQHHTGLECSLEIGLDVVKSQPARPCRKVVGHGEWHTDAASAGAVKRIRTVSEMQNWIDQNVYSSQQTN